MFIPTRVQFDDAITIPKIRLKISDPELKLGAVEMVQGTIPGPYGMQGGFAIVYRFKTQSGKLRALRVFTKKMEPDIRFRYEKMGPYFKAHAKGVTAEFTYHDPAILVGLPTPKGIPPDPNKQGVFPLIEMDWVEGVDLAHKLDELCKKRDSVAIGKIVDEWVALLHVLRQAHIAHGDLSGGNVMVRPDGKLVLVDYDGVYLPDFAGRSAIVLGQPNFQHPDFGKRPFDEWMDEFSALVIYTSLLALQTKPQLWDKYAKYQDGKLISDEYLLLKREDFQTPNQSATFQDLYKLGDPKVKAAVDELKKACAQPVNAVRLPTTLIDPEYEEKKALVVLVEAIKKDDDEEIAKAWVARLEKYALAQPHRSRVELAQKRVLALNGFRSALKSDDDEKIVFGYDKTLLDGYGKITLAERKRHELATKRMVALQKVRRALNANDEEKLAAEYDSILDGYAKVMPSERQKIDQARRCGDMRERVRKAIAADEDDLIVTAYDAKLVRPWTNFTPDEQKRIDLGQKRSEALRLFRAALQKDDDEKIVFAYDKILDGYSKVKPLERERRELALKRMLALKRVKDAIASGDEEKIVSVYSPILDNSPRLDLADRQKIKLAQQCFAMRENVRKAIASDDDAMIVAAYDLNLVRPWTNFAPDEQKRIELAQKRNLALKTFRAALASDDDRKIVFEYDKSLDGYQKITTAERARRELASKRLLALKRVRDAIAAGDEEKMVSVYDPVLDNYPPLVANDREKIRVARQCVQMRTDVRKAIVSDDDDQILAACDTKLLRSWTNFTPNEQKRIDLAKKRTTALAAFHTALKIDDDERIVVDYELILNDYSKVTAKERQRYDLAKKRMVALRKVEKALKSGNEERIASAYDPLLDNYAKLVPADREKIKHALQCVEMRDKVQQAFKTDDDEAIIKAYVANLERPWMNFSTGEHKRIEQAQKRTTALATFRAALKTDKDDQIVTDYEKILDKYGKVTQDERERLALAKKRIALLKTLRLALSGDDDRKIVVAYDPILGGNSMLLSAEWQRIDLARRRVKMFDETRQAIQSDDDPRIVQSYDAKLLRATLAFTPAEQQRIVLAQKRTTALAALRAALKINEDEEILSRYDPLLDGYAQMTPAERERYTLARKRVAALTALRLVLANDDERKIAAVYDPILDNYSKLTPAEREKVDLARRCVEFPGRMRQAIQSDDDEKIVQVFDTSLLRAWTGLTPGEQQRIELARQRVELEKRRRAAISGVRQAIVSDDDEKILAEYDTILDDSSLVNSAERARIELARQRIKALDTFRAALVSQDDRIIVQGYKGVLDGYARVTNAEKQRLDQARRCVAMPRLVREGIGEDDDEKIIQVFLRDLIRPWTGFTSDELQRIELAQKRVDALTRFRSTLQTKDERKIVIGYEHILDKCKNVKPDERTLFETARRCVEMPRAVRVAIATNDDDRIAQIFEPQLDRAWSDLTKEERERIEAAKKRVGLKNDVIQALERGEIEEAEVLAAKAGGPMADQRLTDAKAKFIRNREPSNLRIELEEGEFTAKWDWNPDPQVKLVALAWRTDRMPISPRERGTSLRHVARAEYDKSNGIICILPSQDPQVFVRAFSAIRDNKPFPADNWIYSVGGETTARAVDSRLPSVTCRVLPASGSKNKQIVIQTGDGSPLPELVVLRKEDNMPMSVNDGVPVLKHKPVQAETSAQNITISVDPSWSRYTTLRLFVRHNDQWIAVGGKIPV